MHTTSDRFTHSPSQSNASIFDEQFAQQQQQPNKKKSAFTRNFFEQYRNNESCSLVKKLEKWFTIIKSELVLEQQQQPHFKENNQANSSATDFVEKLDLLLLVQSLKSKIISDEILISNFVQQQPKQNNFSQQQVDSLESIEESIDEDVIPDEKRDVPIECPSIVLPVSQIEIIKEEFEQKLINNKEAVTDLLQEQQEKLEKQWIALETKINQTTIEINSLKQQITTTSLQQMQFFDTSLKETILQQIKNLSNEMQLQREKAVEKVVPPTAAVASNPFGSGKLGKLLDKFIDDNEEIWKNQGDMKHPAELKIKFAPKNECKEEDDWNATIELKPAIIPTSSKPKNLQSFQDKKQDEQVLTVPLKLPVLKNENDSNSDEEEDWNEDEYPIVKKSIQKEQNENTNTSTDTIIKHVERPSESEALHYMVDYFEKKFQYNLKIDSGRLGTKFIFTDKESNATIQSVLIRLDYNSEAQKYHLPFSLPLPKTMDRYDIQAFLEEQLVKKIGVQKRATVKAFRSLDLGPNYIEFSKETPYNKFDFSTFAAAVMSCASKTSQKMVIEVREKGFLRLTNDTNIIFFQKHNYLILKPAYLDALGKEVDQKGAPINTLLIYAWIGGETELNVKFKLDVISNAFITAAKNLKLGVARSECKFHDTQLNYCKYFKCIRIVNGGLHPNEDVKQFCQKMDAKKRLYRVLFYLTPQETKPHFVLLEMDAEETIREEGFYILDHLQQIYWYNENISQPLNGSVCESDSPILPYEISDVLKLGKDEFNVNYVNSIEKFANLAQQIFTV